MSMRFIGRLLRTVHAGDAHLAWQHPQLQSEASLSLTSSAFADGAAMSAPQAAAATGGENRSPPLAWSGVPATALQLALIVEDPDAPLPRPVVHAVIAGIDPQLDGLAEDALRAPSTLKLGKAFLGRIGYSGPAPVPGHGPHRYLFQLFALDRRLSLPAAPTRAQLVAAMAGHVVARGRLVGCYER